MVDVLMSDAEKTFLIHGVKENVRDDGRGCEDYRYMELSVDVLPNTNGSARLRLAHTDVLVGVKAELNPAKVDRPNTGSLDFFLDCAANATPEFEGRGGERFAQEIVSVLAQAYANQSCLDLNALCIVPKKLCWQLYVDIILLECGGNVFDATALAVKSALINTRIPHVTVTTEEGHIDMDIADDPYEVDKLIMYSAPVLVTLNKIGSHFVVDATEREEGCSFVRLMVCVSEPGTLTTIKKDGSGSLDPETVIEMMQAGQRIGQALNKALDESIEQAAADKHLSKQKLLGFLES